jgi:2,4-dienoyl-CoA reductase-like NADH-dependent reductase (Old Yellow Enzyme family)
MNLLEPLVFKNGVRAKNRIALAAMTNSQSHADGTLGDDELAWLRQRAEGGFGIITTCASHVAKDGQGWPGELGTFSDDHVPGLRRLAEAMRAHGALTLAQLFHGGLRADATLTGEPPWSASEAEGVRAATEEDLARVIEQFASAAARCHAAGLDGVELHGAHGYLLTQFLSTVDNRRTDRWGGSLENRARLVREVMRAVRRKVPASFVVGVRLSPEDFGQARGMDLDESVQTARWLEEDGADFLHLSLWRSLNLTQKRPEAHAATVFRAAVSVPLIVAGGLWTREEGERMLAYGADAIALGRAAIGNAAWPKRIEDASWVPQRPPFTPEALLGEGLSPAFVGYMRRWKGFVTEEAPADG